MPIDPVTGAIVSGALSLIQGRKNRKQQEKQNAHNELREDTQIQRAVADGAAAGLSPLASIGVSGFSPSAAPIHSGAGPAADALQGLTQSKINKEASAVALAEAQSRTALNQSRTRQLDQQIQGISNATQAPNIMDVFSPNYSEKIGPPSPIPARRENVISEFGGMGENYFGLNRDNLDTSPGEIGGSLGLMAFEKLLNIFYRDINSQKAKEKAYRERPRSMISRR